MENALRQPWKNLSNTLSSSLRSGIEQIRAIEPDALHAVPLYLVFTRSVISLTGTSLTGWCDDNSIRCSLDEAEELIAHGYGRKIHVRALPAEFINKHLADLRDPEWTESYWHHVGGSAALPSCDPNGVEPVSPMVLACSYSWMLAHSMYIKRCSPEVQQAYASLRYGNYHDSLRAFNEARSNPMKFAAYVVWNWRADPNRMDQVHQVIDLLVELGEFAALGSCFGRSVCVADTFVALASRAPEALKYLFDRSVRCNSNTVRELFLLHGAGRKLHPLALTPEFAVRYWNELGFVAHDAHCSDWRKLLKRADDLPTSPLPMYVLLKLFGLGDSPDKLERHFDAVELASTEDRADYRALYQRLQARW